jgi:hypothetical protein
MVDPPLRTVALSVEELLALDGPAELPDVQVAAQTHRISELLSDKFVSACLPPVPEHHTGGEESEGAEELDVSFDETHAGQLGSRRLSEYMRLRSGLIFFAMSSSSTQ